ncbi:MAG TPA: hypothetical protein P5110_04210 [Candidatus Omnitrophota bacterium]|nr:hypothetical protein [Candidatus Omnitrophota bacterium]
MRPYVLCALLSVVFLCSAYAQELPARKHNWELADELSVITYKEPGIMKEEGWLNGIAYGYAYRGWLPFIGEPQPQRYSLRLEGRNSVGQVDYSGSGTLKDIDDYLFELRGTAGYDFFIRAQRSMTVYAGFGYRYLNDDMDGRRTSTGHYGYMRESKYYYSPLGVEISDALKGDWRIKARLEYDYFWSGRQISHLSDVPGYADVKNKQNKGYGLRSSVAFMYRMKEYDLVIEPYVRYWNIKRSKESEIIYNGFITSTGIEPKNNSREIGLKVAAYF